MAYAVIKVFFANLKRGGILLIQIAVGSLYMFSVPRGYTDGFIQWCKQIIGLCLTAFLQSTILIAGLMVFKDHALLGLGLCCPPARSPVLPAPLVWIPPQEPISCLQSIPLRLRSIPQGPLFRR